MKQRLLAFVLVFALVFSQTLSVLSSVETTFGPVGVSKAVYDGYTEKLSANNRTALVADGIFIRSDSKDGWFVVVDDDAVAGTLEVAYKIGNAYYLVVVAIDGVGNYRLGDGSGKDGINQVRVGAFSPTVYEAAGTVFLNGIVYTVEGDSWDELPAQSVVVDKDGVIAYVGDDRVAKRFIGPDTDVIDLAGDTLMPSFGDGHIHPPGIALTRFSEVFIAGAQTREATLQRIKDFMIRYPDANVYRGRGFQMGIVTEGSMPREWLDALFEDPDVVTARGTTEPVPMTFTSTDGHNRWLNSKSIELCGITESTSPSTGRMHQNPDTGIPTGIFTDCPSSLFRSIPSISYTEQQQIDARVYFGQYMNAWGYTYLMAAGGSESEVLRLRDMEEVGTWKLRANISFGGGRPVNEEGDGTWNGSYDVEAVVQGFVDARERLQNDYDGIVNMTTVKIFNDGVTEGGTAYLSQPYANNAEEGMDPDYRSEGYFKPELLKELFNAIVSAGGQIHVHSIGDQSTEDVVAAMVYAQQQNPDKDPRNTVTHLHVVNQQEKELMGEYGIIAAHQPYWHFKEPFWYDEMDLYYLGEERAWTAYPVKSMIDEGVIVTFSGDHSVTTIINPFWGIETAVTRNLIGGEIFYEVDDILHMDDPTWLRNKDERITLKQAIEAYTRNVAYQMFLEDKVGTLKAGKFADMVRIDQDPFAINPIDLEDIVILQTWLQGELIFERAGAEFDDYGFIVP